MPDPISPANLPSQNWDIAMQDGVMSREDAIGILSSVLNDGLITDAEMASAEEMVRKANTHYEQTRAAVLREAASPGQAISVENIARLNNIGAIAEAAKTTASGIVACMQEGREAISGRVDDMVNHLSRGGFDWAIRDWEAKAALKLLEGSDLNLNVVLRDFADRSLGDSTGRFLRRLVREMPDDQLGRLGNLLADPKVTDEVFRHIQGRLGEGRIDTLESKSTAFAQRREQLGL